jgi:streptogramin lyase
MFRTKLASTLLRKPSRRQPARCVPVLHGLEDRCLLSTFNEYPVPDNGFGVKLSGITAGPDGNVWFTNASIDGGEIESITPAGAITAFPQGPDRPSAIVTGADGNLWFGGKFGSLDHTEINRITTDGTVTSFFLPSIDGALFPIAEVVTLGPDGNVWYGETQYSPGQGVIGHVSPDGQAASSFVVLGSSDIDSITAGPDGNIWFIPGFVDGHYYVGRVTPDFQYSLFEIPGTDNGAWAVTAGPDGNLWATLEHGDRQGHILSSSIARVTVDGQFTEFPLPDGSHAGASITTGPDGNLWFTEPFANQIGMMTPDGQLTEYAIPTPNSNPQAITAGPDGNIWFTEVGSNQIGEIVLNDVTGAAATRGPSPALAQALRAAAVDTVFTGAPLDTVGGVSAQPSAAATVNAGSSLRPLEAVTSSQAHPAVTSAGGLNHHPAQATETADIAGLDDLLLETL